MEGPFNQNQIEAFINEGFIKLENAFSSELAAEARAILWQELGCDPNDPATWTKPVIRLGMYAQEPFRKSANTEILISAFDQLVGAGKWFPQLSMGTFPVRFPSNEQPGDDGWHVDASFAGDDPGSFFDWRINVFSKGRGLLMLFLYSDVAENDAPTRIRIGSHLDIARILEPEGYRGLTFMDVASRLDSLPAREETLATGPAGTVYLCHPFLVHAAQAHRGTHPKFMAQPPLVLKDQLTIAGSDSGYSPVEQAIRIALAP
ncbi:phytanoyl-CoA dioxygenase family protein [Dyadobacter aurulentus]|uniref:phytanoyl-CoA dioxygenase n=1 Tax=Dyadobacter sp. UC 10 TaxID=2605428 RepID=UPI0011F28FA8|nr:phytanoyl-CoA dioxygenase [Dyadobacter sp. UC 10]KAA0992170.1 phytanoyl-CoA dioxygenase [Dyadobacter sp. UC 10]